MELSRNARCAGLVALGLLGAVVGIAADAGTLSGEILDSEGAAISRAYVIIHEDASARVRTGRDIAIRSDKAGRFTLRLGPGFYDVCAMVDAFTPACGKVRIASAQVQKLSMRLSIDAAVVREIGDAFPTSRRVR
jgi:hypothetical protein